MVQNVVILGNGFDLSLGLKTSYANFIGFTDFLNSHVIEQCNKTAESSKNSWNMQDEEGYRTIIKNTFGVIKNHYSSDYPGFFEMRDLFLKLFPTYDSFKAISDNTFVKYLQFLKQKNEIYETNWNNIEKAIAELTDAISFLMENIQDDKIRDFLYLEGYKIGDKKYFKVQNNYLAFLFLQEEKIVPLENNNQHSDLKPLELWNDHLMKELEYLTLLLEFYLYYIENYGADIDKVDNVLLSFIKEREDKGDIAYITFNYTHTLENIFNKKDIKLHHIHGEIRQKSSLKNYENNIVFGIGDYLSDQVNSHVIGYQKFYQRILKQTGSEFEQFFASPETMNIIVFGHSIDPVDKEIFDKIFELSMIEKRKTICFIVVYHDENSKRAILKNLAMILGKEKLVRLSGDGKIVFCHSDDNDTLRKNLYPKLVPHQRISY